MKKSVLLHAFCVIALTTLSSTAQQKILKTDSILKEISLIQLPLNMNNMIFPSLTGQPFFDYNSIYKKRLDSIEKVIPLSYNEFVQKYIDVYSKRKDMIGKMLGLSGYYFPIFEQALKAYDIPEELKYIPVIESAMNPLAVSRVGATGIWQFMFTTARGYGLNIDNFIDERRDPVQASNAAAAYFKNAYEKLGDWLLAIAAFNCGIGNVNRAIAKANSRDFWDIRPYLPLETRNYVPAFIAAVYVMKHAKVHEIDIQQTTLSGDIEIMQVSRFVSLPMLAQALQINEEVLCSLNPCYKKKIVNGTMEFPKSIIMPKVNIRNFDMVYNVLNNVDVKINTKIVQASNDDKRLKRRVIAESKAKRYPRSTSKKYISYKAKSASSEINTDKM